MNTKKDGTQTVVVMVKIYMNVRLNEPQSELKPPIRAL